MTKEETNFPPCHSRYHFYELHFNEFLAMSFCYGSQANRQEALPVIIITYIMCCGLIQSLRSWPFTMHEVWICSWCLYFISIHIYFLLYSFFLYSLTILALLFKCAYIFIHMLLCPATKNYTVLMLLDSQDGLKLCYTATLSFKH